MAANQTVEIEKPTIIILHGNDTFAIQKAIASMRDRLGDPSLSDLNLTRLDGRQATEDDIRSAVMAMPFLAERRLVILTEALARYASPSLTEGDGAESGRKNPLAESKRTLRDKFLKLLETVPSSTALVLVVEDSRVRRRGDWQWEVLTAGHWLRRWADNSGKRVYIQDCSLPLPDEMPAWISNQAEAFQGKFTSQAAATLAEYIGVDTQLAAQEILKLLTFVAYQRPVEEEDVALLTTHENQSNIFSLVDAMGERNPHQALQALHLLLEENDPADLFGMVVRQFRLLLQAREVLDEGGGAEKVAREVKEKNGALLNPYVAQKLSRQAQAFAMPDLQSIYAHLLEIDVGIKTSQLLPELAFETLIVGLAGKSV